MLRNIMPQKIAIPLWGDRLKWGQVPIETDPDWIEWQNTYVKFYDANQREGVGTVINDAGYKIMGKIDFSDKVVLEIGPGDIRHIKFWRNKPREYILADIEEGMLEKGRNCLAKTKFQFRSTLLRRGEPLPFDDKSIDVIVSFYALEHIYPLPEYLKEISRILKPSGILVGAIPCEGGIAWGLGRFFTSRRWFKKNTNITPDKIICWEHPNFADQIIDDLNNQFTCREIQFWPFKWIPKIDINLVSSFIFQKY